MSWVSGGAVVPAILGNVADKLGTRTAMVISLVFFTIAWSFPIYLNLYKGKELDAYRDTPVGGQRSEANSDFGAAGVITVTEVPARTAVPKDLEYSELAQNTGARYCMGELGSLVTITEKGVEARGFEVA